MVKRRSPTRPSSLRRGLARSFSGAGAFLAQLIDMQQREQAAQRQAALTHALRLAEQQNQADLTRETERLRIEGEDEQFRRRLPTQVAGQITTGIGSAQDAPDIPSPNEIVARMGTIGQRDPFYGGQSPTINLPGIGPRQIVGHPIRPAEQRTPVEDLIRASEAKRAGVDQEVERLRQEEERKKEFVGPAGVKGFTDISGSFRPTERSAGQEGQRQAQIKLDQLTPEVVAAEAKRAGLIAGAEAQARARYDTSGAAGGLTPSMRAGVQRLGTSLDMLHTLDEFLTPKPGLRGKWEGFWQRVQALTGADTPFTLYDAVSDSLLPALARSSGEVGNLAEKEQVRYAKLAPKASDPVNIRQAKMAAIQFIIDRASKGAKADEMAPFLDYIQFLDLKPGQPQADTMSLGQFLSLNKKGGG